MWRRWPALPHLAFAFRPAGNPGDPAPTSATPARTLTGRARRPVARRGTIGPEPRGTLPLSIAPPEQRETYCHECLAENPRSRATCVNCGARLRHPREYADVVRDLTPTVSLATFGNVGAAVGVALYGVAIAVLMPQWLAQNVVVFGVGAIVVFVAARFAGRFVARHLNDSSI